MCVKLTPDADGVALIAQVGRCNQIQKMFLILQKISCHVIKSKIYKKFQFRSKNILL